MGARPTRAELATEITDARRSLTSMLASLRTQDWEAESLCDGWAVRDVVGHLLHQYSIYRAPYPRLGLFSAGFRVNRYLAKEASRVAHGRSPLDLLAAVGGAAFERTTTWKVYPWPVFALTEFVIHTQDIRRPLGIPDKPSASQLAIAADVFARPAGRNPFRVKLPPTRFEASDTEWSYGRGPIVRGPQEAIVMVLAGRGQALNDLSGDGVEQLEQVLSRP